MKILAILQNAWFKEPEKIRAMIERRPDLRNEYIRRFLFMGCTTGQRLLSAFGKEPCRQIVWEEASPQIAGESSGVFPADIDHIKESIERHRPDVIIAFGRVAADGVRQLDYGIPTFFAPHPAARRDPMPELREVAGKIRAIKRREQDAALQSDSP